MNDKGTIHDNPMQGLKIGGKSICDKCFHSEVCRGIDNQPCVRCSHFYYPVAEIVKCKWCVYYNTTGCSDGFGWCEDPVVSTGVSDEWFCANGKPKRNAV